jgi:hypothetical protein
LSVYPFLLFRKTRTNINEEAGPSLYISTEKRTYCTTHPPILPSSSSRANASPSLTRLTCFALSPALSPALRQWRRGSHRYHYAVLHYLTAPCSTYNVQFLHGVRCTTNKKRPEPQIVDRSSQAFWLACTKTCRAHAAEVGRLKLCLRFRS